MGTHTSRARASQRAYPYHYACPYPLHRATLSRSPLPLLLFLPNLLSPLRAPSPLPRCASSPSLFVRHPSPASPSPALAASPLPSLLPRCLPLPFLSFPFPSSLPAAVVGGGDPGATKPLVRRGYQRRRSRGTGPIVTGLICAFMPCVFVCFMIVFFLIYMGMMLLDGDLGWLLGVFVIVQQPPSLDTFAAGRERWCSVYVYLHRLCLFFCFIENYRFWLLGKNWQL